MGILHLCYKYPFLSKAGPVVLAYIGGFLIGNAGLLPKISGYGAVLEGLTMLTIPIAIPLLLFSADLRKWAKIAGKTLLSAALAFVAVVAAVFIGFFIFRNKGIEAPWHVAGMLLGLNTGGTPNLASIKMALGADETNYLLIATYDLMVGAIHLLFMMTVAQRLFLRFLPPYRFIDPALAHAGEVNGEEPYWGLLHKEHWLPLLKAFGAALVIFGTGGAATLLFPGSSPMTVVILTITTLGIAASFIPAVHRTEKTYELGMYLIMIFCMVVASMADFRQINLGSAMIGGYLVSVVFGSMLLQALLSRLFRIDVDTFLITSAAFIHSPALVPMVAGALRNREIVFSGLAVGIVGYAVGNYLGILVAWILENW